MGKLRLTYSWANLLRNQETSERTIEAIIAVLKELIVKPGTTLLDNQRRATLIKKALIPNVIIETGKAINWRIGFINVFTIPITIAATMAAETPAK